MPEKRIDIFHVASYREFYECDTAILGIDPGVTTGLSVIAFRESEMPLPHEVEHWGSDQISYGGSGNQEDMIAIRGGFVEQEIAARIADVVKDLRSVVPKVIVVIEDFIIRQQNSTREFLAPVRITSGIVQEIFLISGIKVVYQTPADAKSICKDERMDKWGYQIKTKRDRHSRDADRHSTLFLRRAIENPRRLKIS